MREGGGRGGWAASVRATELECRPTRGTGLIRAFQWPIGTAPLSVSYRGAGGAGGVRVPSYRPNLSDAEPCVTYYFYIDKLRLCGWHCAPAIINNRDPAAAAAREPRTLLLLLLLLLLLFMLMLHLPSGWELQPTAALFPVLCKPRLIARQCHSSDDLSLPPPFAAATAAATTTTTTPQTPTQTTRHRQQLRGVNPRHGQSTAGYPLIETSVSAVFFSPDAREQQLFTAPHLEPDFTIFAARTEDSRFVPPGRPAARPFIRNTMSDLITNN
jgi:hypothetical protein